MAENVHATQNWVKENYIDKTSFEKTTGDIETALDNIIAIQNELLGGDAE